MPTHVNLWGWFYDLRQTAFAAGNKDVLRSIALHSEGWDNRERDPHRTLQMWQEARALAEKAGQAWLSLFHGYWCCEAILGYLDDVKEGLDAAVKLSVEAHKPQYRDCPVVGQAQRILVDAYIRMDILGYEPQIREALDYIETNIPLPESTYRLLMAHRSRLEYECGTLSDAHMWGRKFLDLSEHSDFHRSIALLWLCNLDYRLGRTDKLTEYTNSALRSAQRSQRLGSQATCYLWNALFAAQQGEVVRAGQYLRQALLLRANIGTQPDDVYDDLLTEYYERTNAPEKAIAWREDRVRYLSTREQHYWAFMEQVKYACLLGRLNQPLDHVLEQATNTANRLLKPAPLLAKLERVATGNYDEHSILRTL
jgi:tetratricopeptide (TPR) repeat protein